MITDYHEAFVEFCKAKKLDAAKLIGDALKTAEGGRLLQALNEFTPPLDHSFHPDARFQAHHAGRIELLSLLWRYGTATNAPLLTPIPTNLCPPAKENLK